MGMMIFLSSQEEEKVGPIIWKSKTLPTVCKTVKDADTRAADKCVEDAIYIARCLKEIYSGERGESQTRSTFVQIASHSLTPWRAQNRSTASSSGPS